ncbi:Non-catalytic module family DOC2 [Piromyces sp. E2]|nr:Non-catalytic module family DOC2 [Piromyces sp. E2]|eukprot:OUM65009.1 Non-catalytic module family DOC2 [Piromyces sp. E2]
MKLFYYIVLFTYIVATSLVAAQITLTAGPVSCEYKNKDLSDEYDQNSDVNIKCNGNSCTVNGSGATASNGMVTISAAGTYIVSGSLNGQVRIEATKEDFIHLVLNGVTIKSNNGPAIYDTAANKVVITLVGNNSISDSNNYKVDSEGEPDACIYISSDLSINGSGSVSVTGNYSDAIRCKKDLKLVSGQITIPKAAQKGIKARNSICVLNAVIDITSQNSAMKVTKDDDPEKGFVVIDGGKITISAGKDAIHAETHLTVRDGYIDIKKCEEGIEGQMVDILGGEIHIFTNNDGINGGKIGAVKNGNPFADFGAGNDGSVYINIVGGKIYVDAEGQEIDGIDANGVVYIGGDAEVYTSVNKGTIYGFYAAIDADGDNSIAPGATVVALGTQSGNGGFWKRENRFRKRQWGGNNGGWNIGGNNGGNNGGWNIGGNNGGNNGGWNIGGNNGGNNGGWNIGGGMGGGFPGMMGGDSGKVYQPYIQTSVPSQNGNSKLVVKDRNNNIIVSYVPRNPYAAILVTSPKMVAGETYTITAGSSTTTATANAPANGNPNAPSVTTAPPVTNVTTKTKKPKPTNSDPQNNCSAAIIKSGYKCCSANCEVVYTDADGTWGVENNEWCGCGGGAPTCPAAVTSQGYPCCGPNNCDVYFTDGSGKWGVENGNWCGITSNC